MLERGEKGICEFVFIDADKVNRQQYSEFGLKQPRMNGIIAIDDVLWGGKVALRKSAQLFMTDRRVNQLPFADVVTQARRR
jgi:predicted O-methyltransferase YrrM